MVIQLYSEIGTGDCTAKAIAEKLTQAGSGHVEMRINSPGGSISDGIAIYNLIKQRGDVEVIIDGVCASIATVIMCGARTVTMAKNAMLFIHQPLIVGNLEANADALRKMADGLDMNESAILQTYLDKTKGKASAELLKEMMAKETYINAEKAMELGLVDYVIVDVLSDMAVNLHAGLLLNKSTMAEDIQEPAPAAPAPEQAWMTAINELKSELLSIKTELEAFKAVKAELAKVEEQAVEQVITEKAQAKPHMKAIKPQADSDTTKVMTAMDRAKEARKKFKK